MTNSFTISQSPLSLLDAICYVHDQAFGQTTESDLVRALCQETHPDFSGNACLSISAQTKTGDIAGHILFSPARLQTEKTSIAAALLAPLAILPSCQRQGLGQALIKAGLQLLKAQNINLIFVLGDPAYYSKSGFIAAEGAGYLPPYHLSQAYQAGWQYQNLSDQQIAPGHLQCAPALQKTELWQE